MTRHVWSRACRKHPDDDCLGRRSRQAGVSRLQDAPQNRLRWMGSYRTTRRTHYAGWGPTGRPTEQTTLDGVQLDAPQNRPRWMGSNRTPHRTDHAGWGPTGRPAERTTLGGVQLEDPQNRLRWVGSNWKTRRTDYAGWGPTGRPT